MQLRPNYDEEEEEDEKFKEQLQQWKKTDRDEVIKNNSDVMQNMIHSNSNENFGKQNA